MDDSSLQKSYDTSSMPSRRGGRSRRLVLILFLFLVIFGGIVAGKNYLGGSSEEEKITPTPTVTENEIEFIIETPMVSDPTKTPVPKATATPTPKPTIDPVDKETGLDRSEISIEVLNGSGVTGAASQASDTLKSFGYNISSVGNAETTDYENVTIKIKSNKSNFLDLLKKDLGFSYTIGSSSADLADDSSADALVIVGK
jgi:hypothetical protein